MSGIKVDLLAWLVLRGLTRPTVTVSQQQGQEYKSCSVSLNDSVDFHWICEVVV